MAPTRSKKRKSTESESSMEVPSFPAPPSQIISTKTRDPARTPRSRSPIKKGPMRITMNQKQALVDNLQLEITERARKLRAQYAMQAQGLRTRIEIRVNRIPMALRKANMGELFAKYSEAGVKPQTSTKEQTAAIRGRLVGSPSKNLLQAHQSRASPSPMRAAKRLSDEMTDKENDDLSNPKKRAKGPSPPERTTSRAKLQPNEVLSPRSANSRTLPRSPARPIVSTAKSHLSRPVSPLKPIAPTTVGGAASILTNMVEKAKATRGAATRTVTASSSGSSSAGVGRGKRAPVAAAPPKVGKGRASTSSDTSSGSSGTVVTKAAVAKKAPPKRTVMNTIKGMSGTTAKKAAVPKATKVAAAPTRVLRKRQN